MPEDTFYVEGIQIAKRGIAMDIQKFLPDLAETKFVETFKAEPKPEAAAPARQQQQKPEEEAKSQAATEAKTAETKPAKAAKHKPLKLNSILLIFFFNFQFSTRLRYLPRLILCF